MQSNLNYLKDYYSTNDLFLVPLYLLILLIIVVIIRNNNIKNYPEYKYLIKGIIFKFIGVSLFCAIYLFYYQGGDTISYFKGAKALSKLLLYDFNSGKEILFNTDSPLNSIGSFNTYTGSPMMYMWKDKNTFFVCRISSLLSLLGSNSFLVTSLLSASISFLGVWKLFRLFNILYPNYQKVLAYTILFIPSLTFWGSGIMKDSFVLCSTCWITFNFYRIFIERKNIILNSIFLIINLIVIINIKSYVIISLGPGMMLWIYSSYLKSFQNLISKAIIFPFLLVFILLTGYTLFQNLSSSMGVYGDVNTAIQQAQVIQDDLLREDQYGGNNYNIEIGRASCRERV